MFSDLHSSVPFVGFILTSLEKTLLLFNLVTVPGSMFIVINFWDFLHFMTWVSKISLMTYYRYSIAVITVVPMGKASFVYSYVQRRLMGQYNGKLPFSLVYVLKPLITAIRAIIKLFKIHKKSVWEAFELWRAVVR